MGDHVQSQSFARCPGAAEIDMDFPASATASPLKQIVNDSPAGVE